MRALRAADAAGALAVIHAAFRAQPVATDPPPAALDETIASIAALLAAGGGFGAEAPGGLVGVVLWAEQDGGLYLGRLAVHPAHRRRGIARALVDAVEAEATRRGLTRVHLGVRLALHDNRALFLGCGYSEIGATAHPGYGAFTSMTMEKRLPGP